MAATTTCVAVGSPGSIRSREPEPTTVGSVSIATTSGGSGRSSRRSSASAAAERGQAAHEAEKMPPTASLAVVLYSTFLVGVNLVIVIPTADDYSYRLGADQLFSGLMIGAVPLCAMLGISMCQVLLRRISFKSLLVILAVGAVLGNVLYALAGLMRFKWTLLISRCLIGLCNGFSLPTLYISLTVGMRRRSEAIMYFAALNTLGYAVGPALAAALDVLIKSVHINDLVLDSDTAPGWLMAVAYLLFIVKVILLCEDLPVEAMSPEPSQVPEGDGERLPIAACCAVFWHCCLSSAVITIIEVYAVNVGQRHWDWSIAGSAMFLAALMLCSGMVNMGMGRLTKRVMRSDRAGLLGTSLLGCTACALLFDYNLHTVSAKVSVLGVGLLLVLTLTSLLRGFSLALSSKLVPVHMKGSMNTWSTSMVTLGRGAGGIIGAVLQPESFGPVLLGLFAVTSLVSLSSHGRMKPSDKAN